MCKLIDIIEIVDVQNLAGILVSIDFEKAFDKVEYASVVNIMRWFNFGDKIIEWVELLFHKFSLSTYGYISHPFNPTKGLFQGNLVTPYLFIIVIELLATKLRQNDSIKGLKVNGEEFLLTLFADDLGLLFQSDQKVWEEMVMVLNDFQVNTGTRINYNKMVIYRLGTARKANTKFYSHHKLIWLDEPIKILGVILTHNKDLLLKMNYDLLREKMETLTCIWLQRGLSLFGKILVVNALMMSLFVHKLTVLLSIPSEYLKLIESIIQKFIWNGKPKIAWKVMYGIKEDGGMGLCNLKIKDFVLKTQWIVRAQRDKLLEEMMNVLFLIWELQLNMQDCKRIFSQDNFWTDSLKKWCEITWNPYPMVSEIIKQVLWLNLNIKIGNEIILWDKWFSHGINRVEDLLNDQGVWLSLCKKYNFCIKPLDYLSLRSAIPKRWKELLKNKVQMDFEIKPLMQDLSGYQKVSQTMYRRLLKNENLLKQKSESLSRKCNHLISMEEMQRLV